jgi:hypothetical protein
VPDGGFVTVGAGVAATPKEAWPEIRPWSVESPEGLRRFLAWARPAPSVESNLVVKQQGLLDVLTDTYELGVESRLVNRATDRARLDRASAVAWAKSVAE